MQQVLSYIDENRSQFIDRLVELLKFPSISADSTHCKDVAACAVYLAERLNELGLKVELVQTPGHPIVYGEYIVPENERTLLLYGHYDVQPVDPLDLWRHPPFSPHQEGGSIYARGATDDKGQLLTHLLAIEAYLKTEGSLPVNIKYILEGEEEVASDHLEPFVLERKDRLSADGVVVSDGAMYQKDMPAITYGLRGIAVAEIRVEGPANDLHSGSYGGSLANPATELARIVASLHDENYRITIDGFYDSVRDLESWEREMFASLPFDEKSYLDSTGAPAVSGEAGFTPLEQRWGRPTCEVNGIFGGYQGEGGKTIIPAHAGCKVTMRLVPDQDPEAVLNTFEAHVKRIASPAVRCEVVPGGGARATVVSRESALIQAGSAALMEGFGKEPVFIREGGSIPIVNVFKEVLGLDTLLLGFGLQENNAHGPNENFSLHDYHQGIVTMAHLFRICGE